MSKAKTLQVLSVITFLEIIGMVAWPILMLSGQLISTVGLLIAVIFAIPLIYYIIFIIFLARYAKREPADQNIGLMVFLNVLPLIFLVYILDIF